jgi:hypothetical protein
MVSWELDRVHGTVGNWNLEPRTGWIVRAIIRPFLAAMLIQDVCGARLGGSIPEGPA